MPGSRGNLLAASSILLSLAFCFGCGNDSTTGPKRGLSATLADIDYVKGVYYFLYDPNLDRLQIADYDIAVYLDDYDYGNDPNSIEGRAFMDAGLTAGPSGTYGDPDVSDTTSVRGAFSLLHIGADRDYSILEVYGPDFKVLLLNRQISGEQTLAVAYRARRVSTGAELQVGGRNTGEDDVVEGDGVKRRYMKLLRPPASLVKPDPSGFYSRDNLFGLTRDLELKNFYQLPALRIDPTTFRLTVRQGVVEPPVTSISAANGDVSYLEVVGLDSYDQGGGALVPGHDGKVDISPASQKMFVDFASGILFFPEPRPFAPRIGDAYRDFPGGTPLFPFDQGLSNLLGRRDSLVGARGTPNAANVAIYDKHNVQRALDAVYYIDAQFTGARSAGRMNF